MNNQNIPKIINWGALSKRLIEEKIQHSEESIQNKKYSNVQENNHQKKDYQENNLKLSYQTNVCKLPFHPIRSHLYYKHYKSKLSQEKFKRAYLDILVLLYNNWIMPFANINKIKIPSFELFCELAFKYSS